MRRSKAVGGLALCAAAALALSACGGGGAGGGGEGGAIASMATAKGAQGDTYTAPKVQSSGPVTVTTDNPYTTYNNATADGNNSYNTFALTQVLSRPFKTDGNGKILLNKDVMDSVEVTSTNPMTVTWKIKKGVQWSDGAPWDCKDFYLAWLAQSKKAKKPDGGAYFLPASTTGFELIDQAKCQDPQTFVTTFSSPYADYKGTFGYSDDLLPAHIIEQKTGVPDITQVTPTSPPDVLGKVSDFWNTKWNGFDKSIMPGSGQYVIDSWVQNQSVTLVRNPKWAGNPGGPESITLKAIADPSAQAQALQNHESQVLSSPQPDANAAAQLKGMSAQGVHYNADAGQSFEHLDMNFKNPLFADKAVRTAFAQCVDRNELVDKLVKPVQDNAKPYNSLIFFPKEQAYQDLYSQLMVANADTAKKTLEADGWKLGPDGIYAKDGKPLSFRISHTQIPRRKQTVQLIQSQCKKAGMDVKDDTDPNFLDTRVSQGDYDVALFAWSNTPFKSGSQSIYSTGGGQNWQGLSDPKIDEAFKQAVSQTDETKSVPFYQQADKAVADDVASLPLFQPPDMWAFQGLDRVYFQSYYGALWNANEWEPSNK
jgi:peptide/nickel transport system substrate-binding protein